MAQAKAAVTETAVGHAGLRDRLIDPMDKRWKGAFASIGQLLSKRAVPAESRRAYPEAARGDSRRQPAHGAALGAFIAVGSGSVRWIADAVMLSGPGQLARAP